MKKILSIFGVVLACFASSAKLQKQNVLFIIADDLNCNMGAYGHYMAKTPNLDRLAEEGISFHNAFCNFPLCGPSRVSMMTGLYPDQSTIVKLRTLVRDRLPDVTTMSQNFMKNGYTAARVGKIYHYDNPKAIGTPGHDDPASWQHRVYPKGRDRDEHDLCHTIKVGKSGGQLWYAADGADEEQTDGMVATESIKLLEEYAKTDRPFFLGVGFYRPHLPYIAPKKYFEMYDKTQICVPEIPEGYLATLPIPAQKTLSKFSGKNKLSTEDARIAIKAYYACISFVDAQVGRIMNSLDKLGLKEDTIVVFTSDHGYHMGEHAHFKKNTLFDDSDRIPMIVSYPTMQEKGKRSVSIVEMIDLYPTLSELVGITVPDFVAGKSFVPVLKNVHNESRESAFTQRNEGYTVRTKQYRYTRWLEGGADMIEFYDIKDDPAEMRNLARDPNWQNEIEIMDQLLDKRIAEGSVKPKGIKVIYPERN